MDWVLVSISRDNGNTFSIESFFNDYDILHLYVDDNYLYIATRSNGLHRWSRKPSVNIENQD